MVLTWLIFSEEKPLVQKLHWTRDNFEAVDIIANMFLYVFSLDIWGNVNSLEICSRLDCVQLEWAF